MRTLHVGLLIHKKRNGNEFAQFQVRYSVDFLSCEIYEYYGERETTKTELRSRLQSLALRQRVLADIQKEFPNVIRVLKTVD